LWFFGGKRFVASRTFQMADVWHEVTIAVAQFVRQAGICRRKYLLSSFARLGL
jgi:hypothetical protein